MSTAPEHPPEAPREPRPSPAAEPRRIPLGSVLIGLVVLGFVGYVLMPPAPPPSGDTLAQTVAELQAKLPQDLGDGFVVTAIDLVGRDVVYTVRSDVSQVTDGLRDPAIAADFQRREVAAMRRGCDALDRFLSTGTAVLRRVVDPAGGLLVESRLDAAVCAGPAP